MVSPVTDPLTLVLVMSLVGVASTVIGALYVIKSAGRLGLMDLPGQRRMHDLPTPRGGGIGMVLALMAIVGLAGVGDQLPRLFAIEFMLMIGSLGLVGLLDDQRGLPVLPRLAAHLLAGFLVAAMMRQLWPDLPVTGFVVLPFLFAAATNLANFLDGVNGILSLQVAFVLLTLVFVLPVDSPLVPLALASGIAVVSFVPFNFPIARCFMGDAASGALGFFTAVLLVLAWLHGELSIAAMLLLASGIGLDTSLTLLSRIVRGRKFWRGHREHLYQWLVRSGWSVQRVNAAWLGWNLLTFAALSGLSFLSVRDTWLVTASVLGLGIVFWVIGKRYVLITIRRG